MKRPLNDRTRLLIAAVLAAALGVPLAMAGPSSWTAGGGSGLSPSGGTAVAGEVTYWTSPTAISGDTGFLYTAGGGAATIGTGAAGSLTLNTAAGTNMVGTEGGFTKTSGVTETFSISNPGAGQCDLTLDGDFFETGSRAFVAVSVQNNSGTGQARMDLGDTVGGNEYLAIIMDRNSGVCGVSANGVGATQLGLGTTTAIPVIISTNNATAVTVDSSQRVGIGDTTPAAMLTVGSGDLFQVSSAGNITMNGDLTFLPTTDNNGTVGSASKRFKLISGASVVSGDLHLKSDERGVHWILREEEDGISVVNVVTGKRFRMAMVPEEVAAAESLWHHACRAVGVCE